MSRRFEIHQTDACDRICPRTVKRDHRGNPILFDLHVATAFEHPDVAADLRFGVAPELLLKGAVPYRSRLLLDARGDDLPQELRVGLHRSVCGPFGLLGELFGGQRVGEADPLDGLEGGVARDGARFVDLEEALILQYFAVVADGTGGIVREFPAEDGEAVARRVSLVAGAHGVAAEGVVGLHGRLCLQAISGQRTAVDVSLRIMEHAVTQHARLVPAEATMTAGSPEPGREGPPHRRRQCHEASLTQ